MLPLVAFFDRPIQNTLPLAIMMRTTAVALGRVPLIQFRYGVRAAVAPAAAAATTTPQPAAAQPAAAPQIFDSVWDLPQHLRPSIVSEEESECLRFGGAVDAPVKAKGAKPAAKGAKK